MTMWKAKIGMLQRRCQMVNRDDLMWLAGYLEGEGCFTISINYTKNEGKSYRILVTSEDIDVIERASKLLVGYSRITSSKPKHYHKTFYGTNVNGSRAIGWMMTLYNLMGIRRKKRIKEVIKDWRSNIREYSMSRRAIKTRRDRKIALLKRETDRRIALSKEFVK